MFYYMDMQFESEEIAKNTMGSIKMCYVGETSLGYANNAKQKYRKYTLLSVDFAKLSLINNAIDGSEALAVDTGETYILCNDAWIKCEKSTTWKEI